MSVTYSKYQQSIFDFIKNGEGNAVVNAVAGSGKTFTITNALSLIPANKSILFIAFNKHIVVELEEKLSKLGVKNVNVMTIHSFGMKQITKNLNAKLDADKIWKICTTFFPTWGVDKTLEGGYKNRVKRLVELAKLNLIEDAESLLALSLKHDIEITNGEIENAIQVKNFADKNLQTFDFNDMIYLPNKLNLKCQEYDWVFIDECQDLSVSQQELAKRAIKSNGGRFIAVGDPHQCIYGFAGADIESFKKLSMIENTVSLPLSLTYRCAKSIVENAKEIVPHIEALPDAEEGLVREDGKISEFGPSDMVLSRFNRPLITLCIRLLSSGKKAYVKGKDIGANLSNLIKRTNAYNINDAVKILESEREKLINKISVKSKITKEEASTAIPVKMFEEKLDAIYALSYGLTRVSDVIDRINLIFADEKEGICLSTVHKAKGLEADRVFIVEPAKMPSPWVTQEWESEQEQNIKYVAITRARKELIYVPESEFTTYKKNKNE